MKQKNQDFKEYYEQQSEQLSVEEKLEYVIEMIYLLLKRNAIEVQNALFANLTENGKMTKATVMQITSEMIPLNSLSPEVLYLIYQSVYKLFNDGKIIPPEYLFSEGDRQNSIFYKQKTFRNEFPLVFHNVEILKYPDQYTFSIDIRELNEINRSGLLYIIGNMQRQERKLGALSHVEFNDSVAQEIAKEISNGSYYYNSIRLHLLNDVFYSTDYTEDEVVSYEYDQHTKTLTIHNGMIACLDGQHRLAGIEYALFSNPYIKAKMNILFTIGNEFNGQSIIVQEEKRQPIQKEHIERIKVTKLTSIVNNIANDELLKAYVPFVSTDKEIAQRIGIINKLTFARELQRKYDPDQKGDMKFYYQLDRTLRDFFYQLVNHNEEFYKTITQTHNIFSSEEGQNIILRLFQLYHDGKNIEPILESGILYQISNVPYSSTTVREHIKSMMNYVTE